MRAPPGRSPIKQQEFWRGVSQASSYTLDATGGYGSFVLTRETATLAVARLVTAGQVSFTVTPKTATLTYGRVITAAAATFTLTPETSGLVVARKITAAFGSFTLTAKTATLAAARLITASYGAFAITSQTATLKTARLVTASYGAFTMTAQTAGLAVARLVTASMATFALTPQNAGLLWTTAGGISYSLTAQFGAFAFTPGAATLTYSPKPIVIQKPVQLVGWGRWYRYADLFHEGKEKVARLQPPPVAPKPREPELSPVMSAALERLGSRPRRSVSFEPLDIEPIQQAAKQYVKNEAHKTRERRDREAVEV